MLRTPPAAASLLALLVPLFVAASAAAGTAIAPADSFPIIQTGPGLSPHKEIFLLPYTYCAEYHGRRAEAVFQLSAKHRLFGSRFYVAYSQISFWQAYDIHNSSPLRDTNYNPEIFYRGAPTAYAAGVVGADAGLEHESNGQLVPLSRSWNNFYLTPWYQRGNLLLMLKLRYRIPEPAKADPGDALGDDNPDITDYLGHSDVHLYYRPGKGHLAHLAVRGILDSGRGSAALHYSLPVPRSSDSFLVLRMSHGYGESLLDYRESITRFGFGVMFAR
ncbi:MAG: phospholipase A [bacterium]|nr:phospholipase A [bacterium]